MFKIKCPECEGTGFEDGIEGIGEPACTFCDGFAEMTLVKYLSLKCFIFKCWIAKKTHVVLGPPCGDCPTFSFPANPDICKEAYDEGEEYCWLPFKKYLKYWFKDFIKRFKEE